MEKIAPGAWNETAQRLSAPTDTEEVERITAKRDGARWSAVMGFALMFAAGFHVGFAIGGAAMTLYGVTMAFYWGRRLRLLKGDPWEYDPELDGPASLEAEER